MSLSACFVTRNHASSLPRAVRSVLPVADEVLVLDTGSTDETVRVATELGARVEVIAWDDDFAAGCNAALERARGDWVLLLNHDEELLPVDREALQRLLEREDLLACHLRVEEMQRADQPPPYVEITPIRLVRRHSEVRYVGRLHPHFAEPLEAVAAAQGRQVALADLVVRHHAYLSVPTEDKLRWSLRLLEKELADRPGQLHYLIEYGLTLRRLGDPRATAVLREAVTTVWEQRAAATAPAASAARLLEYMLTAPAEALGPISRLDAASLALRWFPRSPVLLWRAAEERYAARDFARAAELLDRLLTCGETGNYDRSLPFDPRLIGDLAVINLALCRAQLGQKDGAAALLRAVPESSPDFGPAQQLLARLQG